MAEAIDWQGLMRLGYGALRLPPETFWAMTPAELRLTLEGAGILSLEADLPMDRERLNRLISAFPDRGPASPANTKE